MGNFDLIKLSKYERDALCAARGRPDKAASDTAKRSLGIECLSSADKLVSNKRFVSDAFLSKASTILFKILPLSIQPAFHTSATSLNFKSQEYLRLAIFSS